MARLKVRHYRLRTKLAERHRPFGLPVSRAIFYTLLGAVIFLLFLDRELWSAYCAAVRFGLVHLP